jgi:hypothetical protein
MCGCAVVQDRQQQWQQKSGGSADELVESVWTLATVAGASSDDADRVAAIVRVCPDAAGAIAAASTAEGMVKETREHGEDAGAGRAWCSGLRS